VSPDDLLSRLVRQAGEETERRRALVPEAELIGLAARYVPKDFAGALRGPELAIIAEMKQRTPSMGVLAADYRPGDLARAYTRGGAAAISVLTHGAAFGGQLDHIRMARAQTELPILRKDFVTDAYQILEARAAGADAVLLIVAALETRSLEELLGAARKYAIGALVEVHDEREAVTAVSAGAEVIGVNHRDLRTFALNLGLTDTLRKAIPSELVLVAESGIHTPQDARRMREAGADAILVGEALMRAADPGALIGKMQT